MFFGLKKTHSVIIASFAVYACIFGAHFPALAGEPQTASPATSADASRRMLAATAASAAGIPLTQEKTRNTSSVLTTPKQRLDTGNKKNQSLASAPHSSSETARIQKQLDSFAKRKLALINQGLRPGKNCKEVTKQNGVFVARYIHVHPETLKTRFRSNTSNPPVRYVGFLQYQEMHYECQAETREKALEGPFSVVRLRNMTEIITYDHRGWHD